MHRIILLIACLSLISGLWLRYKARNSLTEFGKSVHWYDVKYWIAPWKAVDIYSKQGLRLHLTSVSLIVTGAILYLSTSL